MANQIINSKNLTSKEIPELYVRYFNPKIYINTDITIPYYVSDNTQAEYLNNSNTKSFTTIVTFNSKVFSSTTTAGEFTINIGSASTTGETYFSIYTIDGNGVASAEQFFDILIVDDTYPITQSQTYIMTETDLSTYNIKVGESVSISDAKLNGAALTNLFKGAKGKGYRKIIMLKNTYMLDYHGDKVTIPDQFTVSMNGATFKATQCNDVNVSNLVDLRDCFDSHVINGNLVGNYDGFDFEATKTNTNYYIPGEGLAVAEINGARYSSFKNMTMSYSVGYNLGVFGGKRSGYVGTPGKLAFKNQYYIDANGNQITSSDMCTTDITDISTLLDRGELQCSVYLGYGGLSLNKAELFVHFYNSSQKYLKTVKTRQYQIVKIPPGAKYVRITGFTSVTESSGLTICHTGQATNCELINITSHNTRTCAMHPGIYNHLLIKDCTFNKVADENEYKVTKLALDFEDGYENGRNLFFINNEVYDGTSALTIQRGFNCNVIKCRNFGLDLRGHIKGALIKNNFFNEGSIYTTDYDSQSHMKLDNNTFFRSLKFLKWDDKGNYPTVGLTNLDCKQNYQNNSNTNVIIDNAVSGSGSEGAPSQTYYNIVNNMPHCTTDNSDNLVLKDSSYKATITPMSGYDITSITVTMGGVDITSTALSEHTINISKVTGNVNINVITREIESYRITNKLTNCTNSNTVSSVLKNKSYAGSIVSNEGYDLYSITVTMDGADITTSSVSGNSINISNVTGDVIITAVCTKEVSDIIYDNGTMNKGTLKLNNATAESTYIKINQNQDSSVAINDYKLTLNKNDKVYMDIGLDTDSPSAGYSIRIPQLGDSSVNNFTDTNMINESQISTALNGKDKVTIYWTVANTVTDIDLTLTSYFARVKIFKIWIDKNSTESGSGGGTTPEKLTISNIPNITQPEKTEFYIEYTTNIAVAKHEVSWDGGNVFYDKTTDVVANGTSYKFKHDNKGSVGTYKMAIRVTTSSGVTKTSNVFTVTLVGSDQLVLTQYKRLNDGVVTDTTDSTYYSTVNKMSVTSSGKYTLNLNPISYVCVCFYNSSDTYLGNDSGGYIENHTSDWSVGSLSTTFTVPSSASYIRICGTSDGTQVTGTLKEDSSSGGGSTPTPGGGTDTSALLDSTGAYVIDDFSGSSVDSNKWGYELGYVRNNETQKYTNTNAEVNNGILALRGKKASDGSWTSASIISKGHFAFMYGKIVARVKACNLNGAFGAFWTLGDSFEFGYKENASPDTLGEWWAYCGEFDVMEFYNGKLTCGTFFNEKEESGRVWYNNYATGDWHEFAMEWNTDGSLIFSIDGNELSRTNATDNRAFHIPHFILLNQAIGASGGTPDSSTTEITQYVDWVKYYPLSTDNLVENSSDFYLEATDPNDSAHNCVVRPKFNDNCINKSITWESSNPSLVTCHSGLCGSYAGANGEVVITGTSHSGVSKQITLTVTDGVLRAKK